MNKISKAELMVKAKFVVNQLMGIICDATGKSVNVDAVDNVFEDLFGYKRLASKLDCTRDDLGMLAILSDFGINDIFAICNDPKVMDVIADLVVMDLQMHKLHKILKRCDKKGEKRPKNKVKDYKYVSELYEKTIKVLRKQLGYSSKMSLKSSFDSAKALVTGYSREGRSYFEQQYYGDYDDYDDDDEEVTPYDEYLRSIRRKKPKSHIHERFELLPGQRPEASRTVFQMKHPHSMGIPLEDLEEDDDDDGPLLERYDDTQGDRTINRKLDALVISMERMMNMFSAPSANIGVNKTDPLDLKSVTSKVDPTDPILTGSIDGQLIQKINENEARLAKGIESLTKIIHDQSAKQESLEQVLYGVIKFVTNGIDDEDGDEDDDDEDDDDQRGMHGQFAEPTPAMRGRGGLGGGPRTLRRDELVDMFNQDSMGIPPEADERLRNGELSPGFHIGGDPDDWVPDREKAEAAFRRPTKVTETVTVEHTTVAEDETEIDSEQGSDDQK